MTERLPVLTPRALERAGFFVHHQTGSHCVLRNQTKPRLRVTVPVHARDVKRGLLAAILRQAELTPAELHRFL
jgi:predicted RNA binding protein YcfA (HicA-like mRNA interferase family)